MFARDLRYLLLIATYFKLSHCKENTPVIVNRRALGDTFTLINSGLDLSICSDDQNLTYLVSSGKCVKNNDLLRGNL